jgi:hypothetical protein
MFNTYIIIKIHLSTVNSVLLDPPGVITLEFIRLTVDEVTIPAVEFTTALLAKVAVDIVDITTVDITTVGVTAFVITTMEEATVAVATVDMFIGGVNELFVVDEVEVCIILVDEPLFVECVVGIGTGV